MQLFYEGMHPFGSRACICVAFVLVPGCFMRACIRLGPGHAFVLHLFWSGLFYEGMHPFGSRACICVAFVLVPGMHSRGPRQKEVDRSSQRAGQDR
jgi:hypothetical protein